VSSLLGLDLKLLNKNSNMIMNTQEKNFIHALNESSNCQTKTQLDKNIFCYCCCSATLDVTYPRNFSSNSNKSETSRKYLISKKRVYWILRNSIHPARSRNNHVMYSCN